MSEYAWIDLGDGRQVFRRIEDRQPARSELPMPMIACDHMDPIQAQHDGKMYDSKSVLRRSYKAAGMIEIGNDPARLRPKPRPKPDEKAIRAAIEQGIARYERGERVQK